jgi:hypothetical protein
LRNVSDLKPAAITEDLANKLFDYAIANSTLAE